MAKLSKRTVDQAQPGSKNCLIWDEEIKGFGLLILPSGMKSYIFQYRTVEGRSRRVTIGKHGAFTPDEARTRARDLQHAVLHRHEDPLEQKREQREALTCSQLFDTYLQSAMFATKAESTRKVDMGRITNHLRPHLGKKLLRHLTQEDVRRALNDIGSISTARGPIRLLKAILSWAVDEKYTKVNVAQEITIGPDGERTTILERSEDYEKLFRAIDDLEQSGSLRPTVADAIRVIAFTGARRNEIAALRWEHVDLKRGVITLTKHKTARSSGKPRIIGLPAVAQAILAKQPPGGPQDWVFPPASGQGPLVLNPGMRLIRVKAGLPQDLSLHSLRHSLASSMAMQGASAPEIMTAMGHTQLSTVQRYIHWARDGHQGLAEKAAAGIVGAFQASPTAEVVPLRKK